MQRKNKNYEPDFKIKVAKAYLSGEYGGYLAVAKKFNVQKNGPYVWANQLKTYGESYFFEEKRGRKSKFKTKSKDYDDMSIEEKLKYKEMECDILKKLEALLIQLGEQ